MRALMRSLAPTSFEDVAALVALYRPGPDGGQHAQRLRRPEERPEAGRVPPPRRRGDPGRHLRADDLPGVGDAGRPEVRRLLAGRGRQPPQGLRQEDPRADRQGAGEVRRRLRAPPATAPSSASSGSTSSSRSPTTPSTRPRLRLRARRLPDRLPQGELPGRVPRRPAHERQDQPREGGRLPRRVPRDGHHGATCPTSTGPASDFIAGRRADDGGARLASSSACRRCATWARGWSRLIVAEREANGPFADFYDFCERVDTQVLNKRTVESLIKAGAFDDVGHPRKGLLVVFEQIIDHTVARRRERGHGRS